MRENYQLTAEEIMQNLNVGQNGLDRDRVENMRRQYGANVLHEAKKTSLTAVFLSQFNDFLVWILLAATIMSAILGKVESAGVIIVVLIVNAVLGTIQHYKAEESLAALKALSSPKTKIIRNGETITVDSKEVVVGDLMIVDAGDFVSADGRLLSSFSLRLDESAITGESVNVEKDTLSIEGWHLSPGDQRNMIFSGTHVTYGRGLAIVTGVGRNTEIGKIATLLEQAKDNETPLQKSLELFGKKLAIVILSLAAVILALNLYRNNPLVDAMMFSIALAVAAIPEALSSIVTIVLAIGTRKMAQQNAIVRKLYAVEGLGSVSVICSDKTGTLTQNKMSVKKVYVRNQLLKENELNIEIESDRYLLLMAALCNDSITTDSQEIGDPTEVALVHWCELYGWDELSVREHYKRISELPFDSERKLMSTVHDIDGRRRVITKGALDVILKKTIAVRDIQGTRNVTADDISVLEQINRQLSQQGLRVLAFAYKDFAGEKLSYDEENKLTFIGLVAMMDPPRPESKAAVEDCRKAGIRTVMITGDHIITAVAIAKEIGILEQAEEAIEGHRLEGMSDQELIALVPHISVYARVSPEHKIRIVRAWQELGHAVAMTGDGVNDAPALKQADIGVAMGISGTEVSKSAASIVLTDDNFATIVKAIANGRSIYRNITNSVTFLLSGNTAAILVVLYASLANLPTPFTPVQLLFINLLTDSLPAIAIGIEPPQASVMTERPRNIKSPLMNRPFVVELLIQGFLIAIMTITAFYLGLKTSPAAGVTMAFAVLCLARLMHGFTCRIKGPLTAQILFSNRYSWVAFGGGCFFLAAVLAGTPLKDVFEVADLTPQQYLWVGGLSMLSFVCIQLVKRIQMFYRNISSLNTETRQQTKRS